MKVLLMYRDRDFDLRQELPWNESALMQDLELGTLLRAMAGDDKFLFDVARSALLSGLQNDVDTILYRQEILKDCLKNPAIVRGLYDLAGETIEQKWKHRFGIISRSPDGILYEAIKLLQMFMGMLRKLRGIAEAHAGRFESEGFAALFAMIERELSDEYLASIQDHLTELRFRKGVLLNAELGDGNEGTNYVLRRARGKRPNWLKRIFGRNPPAYTFRLHERDDAGARILSDLQNCVINLVANALAQSADHVLSFFDMLRTELAFYVGCLNLHGRLVSKEEPVCFPRPAPAGERRHRFSGLYDACLSLLMERKAVGNAAAADKNLVIITGANQGGKSVFLRSIGLAQMMMQCGMFVAAESFDAELCTRLFTHYKREEDATMKSGKLDEELARMSDIVDHLAPNSMLLCNESFAATNEREGSEIARQIVCALLERRVKVFFVTHLYEFAHGLFDRKTGDAIFLRAERRADGTRTFRLVEGEPLQTSYGEDLYREIFPVETGN
jgi:adenosyl cobinamide kinase/adenosyl cobinamide phosphate guanylyltransferase